MKKLSILTVLAALLLFTGCEELEKLCNISAEELGFTEDFTKHFNAAVYVYQQTDRVLRDTTLENAGTAVIDGAICTRTPDSVVIDFGSGVASALDGKIRKGSIRVGISGDYMQAGTEANLVMRSYSEEDQMYDGDIRIVNVSPNANTPALTVEVIKFQADTLKLTSTPMNAAWVSGFDSPEANDDEFNFSGTATLENVNNAETFQGIINSGTPLNINTGCIYTFVSGVIDLVPSNPDKYPTVGIDFVDGDCANVMMVNVDCDGNSLQVPLNIK